MMILLHFQVGKKQTLFNLSFNITDQFLYIQKIFTDEKESELYHKYEHEIKFYQTFHNENPFICKFYGEVKKYDYIHLIIEYIEGQTLEEFIKNNYGKLDKMQKIQIILEIMCAIEYLHLNNFIYRDLKSDNIIIGSNRDAILIDFDNTRQNNDTEMTSDIVSPKYASPEQQKTNKYNISSDIYSLGKIIQFILTGNDKFDNNENLENSKDYKYLF